MPFTDRFIKVPMKVYNKQEENQLGKEDYECDSFDDYLFINPFEIESFGAAIPGDLDFEKENSICTNVRTKSGEHHLVFMGIKDFEKLLNEHQK